MKNHSISPRGTQAPSEKHLEDWLWEHPESLGRMEEEDDIRAENERFNAANAAEEYLTRMAGGEL